MVASISPRSATGIVEQEKAEQVARGMAEIYDEPFVVLYYPGEQVHDVEPATVYDRVGVNFVVARFEPEEEL